MISDMKIDVNKSKETILIVDDVPINIQVLARALKTDYTGEKGASKKQKRQHGCWRDVKEARYYPRKSILQNTNLSRGKVG